jgi:hypothetical protein
MCTRSLTHTPALLRSLCFFSQAFTEENFRGLRNWAQIFTELKAAKVKTVTVEQVLAAISSRRVRGVTFSLRLFFSHSNVSACLGCRARGRWMRCWARRRCCWTCARL